MVLAPISLPDLTATEALAKRFAAVLSRGDIIALRGNLGTGKTTFARALLKELGIEGEVPSPTFTLVQNYETVHFPIYHFDLYRLKNESELDELGWDDVCAEGVVIVEWPEHGGGRIPEERVELQFTVNDRDSRNCTIVPHSLWMERLKDWV